MKKEYVAYIIFAVLAALLNYLIQVTVEYFCGISGVTFLTDSFYKNINPAFVIKLFSATIGAFAFKFIADKLLIFKVNRTNAVQSDVFMIILYTLFAVFTTVIFWGTQFVFRLFTEYEYAGMVVGLAIGYTVKYFMDRRFVFQKRVVRE